MVWEAWLSDRNIMIRCARKMFLTPTEKKKKKEKRLFPIYNWFVSFFACCPGEGMTSPTSDIIYSRCTWYLDLCWYHCIFCVSKPELSVLPPAPPYQFSILYNQSNTNVYILYIELPLFASFKRREWLPVRHSTCSEPHEISTIFPKGWWIRCGE